MEDVALNKFNKFTPSGVPMAEFNPRLSDEIDKDYITTATNLSIILNLILSKYLIDLFMTSMWDHTYSCAKQYHCEYDIYLLSCLDLELRIIIYKAVGEPGHGKDVVDGMNVRDKRIIKLSMAKILNTELIYDDPNI